jgi:hypothetical protein
MQFIDPLDKDILAQLRERAASPERIAATKGRMLLELVECLQNRGPNPQAGITLFNDVITILLLHPGRAVEVWVDWQDAGKTLDGLPVMHYRLQIRKPDGELSEDARATTPVEAARLILCA